MADKKPWEREYGTKPAGGTILTDPYAPANERRAEEDQAIKRERLRLERERMARQAEKDAADAAKAAREATDAEKEAAALEAAQRKQVDKTINSMRTVISKAREARSRSNDWFATGFGAETALGIGGSSANDVQEILKPIKANEAFGSLQAMREASPTGGALGAVSERELSLLEATIAGLDQTQSDTQFQKAMSEIEARYTRALNALMHEREYYKENGSLVGYTPLSDDDLNKPYTGMQGPGSIDAAGSGAESTLIDVPEEMQAEYRGYIQENWGNLDADKLSRFMTGLEMKYNRAVDVPDYTGFVEQANQAAIDGAGPEVIGPIPATDRELSGFEQGLNNVVSNPFGTGAASFANSLTMGIPAAMAGREKMQAAQDLNPISGFAGDMLGGTLGTFGTGFGLGVVARGANLGGRAKTVATNPLTADVVYGAGYGALSDDDAITGALTGAGGAVVGDQLGRLAGRGFASLRAPKDVLTAGQRTVVDSIGDLDEVAMSLARAEELGVPMTLADASPELQSLAGSSVRFSPTVAGEARDLMYRRNQGQMDRLAEAVERDLGPVTNIPQRSDDLLKEARTKAAPLYDEAYAAPGAERVNIDDLMQRPTFRAAMKEAYREALDEGEDPRLLGFVMDEAGEVNIDPAVFGGRYSRATVSGEGNFLEPRTFTSWNGREVTKRGPLDLAGWLRTKGGLRDSGGELAGMGFTNASRGKSAELVGREAEFGPLVNPDGGLDFDTAAQMAQEAGYFPPGERIDINTFLDTLRNTVDGVDQRFAMDDLAEVEAFRAARGANNEVRAANGMDGGLWDDLSEAAGPDRPFAPAEAYGDTAAMTGMSWKGLDYIKRGLDNVIENNTDGITGANPAARRALEMKNMLVGRMDDENWTYRAAREAYGGPVQERGFLQRGVDAYRTRPDELGVQMGNLTPEQAAQMRLGYQSEVMGRAGDLRNNSNPWSQLNTANTEGRLGVLYEGAEDADIARLLDQRDLELQLAGSANRLIGNSLTAEREVADAFFQQKPGIGGDVAQGIVETGALGGPWLTVGKSIGDRFLKDRREAAALEANRALADEIGPMLLGGTSVDDIIQMSQDDAAYQAIVQDLLENSTDWGRRIGTGASAATANALVY